MRACVAARNKEQSGRIMPQFRFSHLPMNDAKT
jgi:hypothetical protein